MQTTGSGSEGQRLTTEERQRQIEELLRRQGLASLREIMEVTGASVATSRRDLTSLERRGLLARIRGGARAIQRQSTLEEEFEIRQSRDRREKRLIGQRAARLIDDGMTVYLTDGTTSFALAQCLVRRHITVVTGALNIAQLLAGCAGVEVIVIGGRLRATSFGTIGPLAVDTIHTVHADIAVINADGITPQGGVRDYSLDDAASARAMSENSNHTLVMAAPSRIGYEAQAKVLDWAQVDTLVTAYLPAPFTTAIGAKGVRVLNVARRTERDLRLG